MLTVIFLLNICHNFFATNAVNTKSKLKENEIYKIEIIVFSNNIKIDNLYSSFDKIAKPKGINVLKDTASPESKKQENTDLDASDFQEISALNNNEQTENQEPDSDPKLFDLFYKINQDQHSLKTFDKKLQDSPNYKIISHYAWYQNLSKKDGVYFFGGENYYNTKKNDASTEILATSSNAFDNSNKIDLNKLKKIDNNYFKFLNPEWELEGLIYLQKFTKQKIHIDINLLINAPVILANYLHYKTFTIHQNRNILINESNYFDNPYFGTIVYITKL